MNEKVTIENTHLKENPFTVPGGYFESIPENVSKKLNNNKVIRFRKNYIIISSVAASIVLVFVTFSIMYFGEKSKNNIEKNYIEAQKKLIQDNLVDLSSEEIIDYLTHEDVDVTTLSLTD